MLGKPGTMRPVNSSYCAAEWTTMSPWHERRIAMSSTHCARFGKRSDTSMPLRPYLLNVRFVPKSFAVGEMNWYFASPKSFGRDWPCSWFSSGFGSKVSRWLGPPDMKRKITDFAFGVSVASFGASGLIRPSSARSRCWWRIDASASEPKPQNASWMNSRRVRVGRESLWNIKERIQIEEGQGELFERLLLQELQREAFLVGRRRPVRGQAEAELDLRGGIRSRFAHQPFRERGGQGVRHRPVQQFQRLGR